MAHKHVELFKRAFVEELGDTFAGGVFTALVLFLDCLFAAADTGFGAHVDKLFYFFELVTHIC